MDKEVTEFFNLFVRNRLYKVSDDPKGIIFLLKLFRVPFTNSIVLLAFEGNPEYNAIRTKIAQICTEPLSSLILSIDDRVTKGMVSLSGKYQCSDTNGFTRFIGNIKPFLKDFLAKYETLNERSELWEQSVNNYALRDLAFNFRKLDYESLLVQPFAAYSQFHAIDRNLIGADGNQWLKDTSTFNFLMLDYQQTMVQPFRFLIGLGCLWKRVAKEAEKLIEEGKFDALKEGYDKFLVIRTNSYGTIGFSNSSSSSLL